jgi:hypothetical protein
MIRVQIDPAELLISSTFSSKFTIIILNLNELMEHHTPATSSSFCRRTKSSCVANNHLTQQYTQLPSLSEGFLEARHLQVLHGAFQLFHLRLALTDCLLLPTFMIGTVFTNIVVVSKQPLFVEKIH